MIAMDTSELTDAALLRAHVTHADPAAFPALRRRYLNLVYAAAIRQSADPSQAEDVTQAVFILLAQRANSLAERDAGVAGWLLLTTRNVARNARRTERRLKDRERKAAEMRSETIPTAAVDPSRLASVIDLAMSGLNAADRDAIAERYFRSRSVGEVASVLKVSEAAAGKRIARALGRLRQTLMGLGITTSDAALAVGLPLAVTGPTPPASLLHPVTGGAAAKLARSTVRAARVPVLAGIAAVTGFTSIALLVGWYGSSKPTAPPTVATPVIDSTGNRDVTLHLIDPVTHGPIPNATVSLVDDNDTLPPEPAKPDGTFTLTLPKPLTFLRTVCHAPGRVPTEMNFTEGTFHGDRLRDYVIPMETGTRIGGIVTNEMGDPLENATVRISNFLEGSNENVQLALHEQVTTDPDGRWHFDSAPANLRPLMIELRRGSGPWVRPDITLPAAKLRDETFTQQIDVHRGRAFDGLVTDRAGEPIAGAVVVFREDRYEENSPSGRTDPAGRFHVDDVDGSTIATVQAVGFAPQQQRVDSHSPAELQFRLLPASTLHGTVVDRDGQPVPHAAVEVEKWNDNRAIKWTTHTSTAGEFIWISAPADDVQLNVRCTGYADLIGAIVQAGKPNRLVMFRPVQVVGTVTDAATHTAIDKFKLTYGNRYVGTSWPTWQTQDTQTLTGSRFTASISEFSNGGQIRVDADGYQPFISRWINGDEQNVTLEFAMKKGSGPAGVVLSPDGAPLRGVRVIGVQGGTSVMINPDSMDHLSEWQNVRLATTDAAGSFAVPAFDSDSPNSHVVIDCPQGFADVDAAAIVAAHGQLRLQKWGVMHGTYRRNGKAVAGAVVTLSLEAGGHVMAVGIDRRTTTDADGKFEFDNVPPGRNCRLYDNVKLDDRSTRFVTIGHSKVEPGQTVTANFGGVGRPVTGTLVLPTNIPADADAYIRCRPSGPVAALRAMFGGAPATVPDFVCFPDHTFRADDVPPGQYQLTVSVCSRFTPQHPTVQDLAGSVAELVVPSSPPCPNDVPVDLGKLETHAVAR